MTILRKPVSSGQPMAIVRGPVRPRRPGSRVPLTAFQQLLWREIQSPNAQFSSRSCVSVSRVFGELDYGLLQNSFEAVIRRHEALSARIVVANGVPEQCFDTKFAQALEVVDLGNVRNGKQSSLIEAMTDEFAAEKIDPTVEPLFKAKLLRVSAKESVLVFALDQLVSDGISNDILSRDVWRLYDQFANGLPASLPELPIQFADYAVWQQEMHTEWLQMHDAYWTDRLAGAPPARMPIEDAPLGAVCRNGALWESSFGPALSTELHDLARRERTMLALLLLTIYSIVMFHWCNQRDLVIPVLENGRDRPELENSVGFFAQLLLLRIEGSQRESFRAILRHVEEEFYTACSHRDVTQASLVEHYGETLITDLHFNWLPKNWAQWSAPKRLNNGALSIQPFPPPFPVATAIPPVKFLPYFLNTSDGIKISVAYRPDLVEIAILEMFALHLLLVAEEAVRNPMIRWELTLDSLSKRP